LPSTPSSARITTIDDEVLVRAERSEREHVRRHQLFLIEALVDRGCSEREIVDALHDDDRS
jgi:hypothetical protein